MRDTAGPTDEHEAIADAFDRTTDPLAVHAPTFDDLTVDPFDLFFDAVAAPRDLTADTKRAYRRVIDQWVAHMDRQGRHPACPNERHVRQFVRHCCDDRGNQPDTARTKLHRLDAIYHFWQRDPAFPHPQTYDPFELVLSKLDLTRPPQKDPPRLSIDELTTYLRALTHIRDRAVVLIQLKLGVRAGEVCNLRLSDVTIDHPDLAAAYPSLGSHPLVTGRDNAVCIPSRYERSGNKSGRPRVLPLDDELRATFVALLMTRPDTGANEVFYTTSTHNPLDTEDVRRIWAEHFQDDYPETETHRAVTSHFGRHRFTTHWLVSQDWNRELVKYMRGDRIEGVEVSRETIDSYVHTYYEDIVERYRAEIYDFGLLTVSGAR
ncbi:tyrosine-type recombinase/integrase [Haloplanus natans]|uniref:tyrosine-type recombinase/integrase n=1 Tax=Haloplanus natans TaxID=376171 RepID=UPI0009FEBC48|nr:site-specific integrase [Haloplanus natans]